ncbi:STAS domain-containing protein [Cognataquiflexum rubidum]|uniref:STAS domain-containing protein n=1 Tax=Cognataquiflexum rubidum TaxID=2922273 RepID=UPI001F12B699|nr:STAS domain-containing protein [Cognataquiflexum rubidum]MCH6236576.1 STAS domain-containing protein [Cognataquiflexum rubidum]
MLNIEKRLENDIWTLILTGEIDASNSVELDAAISEVVQEGAKSILIDCAALDYISSAGLGVFMSYLDEFEENNVKMVIFALKDKVFQVFHILGLDQLIIIRPTKEEALEG